MEKHYTELKMMDESLFERLLIPEDMSLRDVLVRLDETGLQILLITSEDRRLIGVLTDGDIRRALLKGMSLDVLVSQVMNRHFTALTCDEISRAEALLLSEKFSHVPIVDTDGHAINLVMESFLHKAGESPLLDIPVVIMAGGKGTRLSPLSNILPKSLMPVGDQTMIEKIMDTFVNYGFRDFKVIVNFKREMIKSYFAETSRQYAIKFIDEQEFLGTAGGLRLLRQVVDGPFVLTNCDIVAELNYPGLLAWHREHKAHLTVVGVRKRMDIPYGVIKIDENYGVDCIDEKPFFNYLIVSGVYIVDPAVIDVIPADGPLDMDSLIRLLIEKKMKVACYPIENGWFDIGQFEEYRKLLKHFGVMNVQSI
ncbi:MAG: CBS domain-containing protein [Kiritimatiellae bacterium]|nr:CBS domain-containing protein [Verrucomicrobiota bacterium]MCG2680937.1 CBS domain-containing protein [Kiritimatiellia bacterium]